MKGRLLSVTFSCSVPIKGVLTKIHSSQSENCRFYDTGVLGTHTSGEASKNLFTKSICFCSTTDKTLLQTRGQQCVCREPSASAALLGLPRQPSCAPPPSLSCILSRSADSHIKWVLAAILESHSHQPDRGTTLPSLPGLPPTSSLAALPLLRLAQGVKLQV